MQCRNCGAEIAEKALICYRCGTATAEAKYKPAPLGRRTSRSRIAVVILIIAVLLLLALYLLIGTASGKRQSQRRGPQHPPSASAAAVRACDNQRDAGPNYLAPPLRTAAA